MQEFGNLLRHIDLAILREGLNTLNDDSLQSCCRFRGLNIDPTLSRDEMMTYLRNWLEISKALDRDHISLLLHLPVLLGYNHKTRLLDDASVY